MSIVIILMNLSLISTVIRPYLDSLNVAGTKMNISERIVHMISLWKSVMTNCALEELMINAKSSILGYMYIICFCVLTLGAVPMIILGKGKLYDSIILDEKINMLCSLFIVLISYAVGAIGFISRMGGQHFTPIFFIVLLIIGIEGDIIITFINKESLVKLIYIIGLFTIFMGIINTNILHKNLQFTGGKNKFNAQINELSYEALDSRRKGINDLYIFPDWGFMCGFNYLTMNQIPYLTTLDFEKIELYTDNKYGIKICVWDYDDALEYVEMLKTSGFYNLDINVKKGLDGEEAFYIVSFK